jgi:AcrR family transcriptional regulator
MSPTDMTVSAPLGASGAAGRSASSAGTRERLLESAQALFAARGLHGVTTHDIARHAGFASGTFYLHFRDKREIFREIALETAEQLRACVVAATRTARDLPSAVAAHAHALVDFAESHRDVMQILFGADADAAAIESDVLDWLAASVEERRRERAAAGHLHEELDPGVLAQAIVGMWARVIAWWLRDPSRASREQIVRTLTRIQLSGTQPDPAFTDLHE